MTAHHDRRHSQVVHRIVQRRGHDEPHSSSDGGNKWPILRTVKHVSVRRGSLPENLTRPPPRRPHRQ
jgi:hypothetical protein